MGISTYLNWLKKTTSRDIFNAVLNAVDEDIKFNRVAFGKRTSPQQFVVICQRCHTAILRCY